MIRSIRSNLSIISLALLAVAVSATVAFAQGSGQMPPMPPSCAPGQQPTQSAPCMPSSGGGAPNQGGGQPNQGGGQPNQGGGQDMPPCEKGQFPTATKRCLIPPCEAGQQPSNTAPCMPADGLKDGVGPGGGDQGGGESEAGAPMSQPPPTDMLKKTFVMNVEVEGSGDDPGTFAASDVAIIRGVAK